jgi:WD40 repeat protein
VTFSPDGQLVASASASADRTVRLWNAATGEEVQKLEGHSSSVSAVAFSPDGQLVASASADTTVRFWNAVTGEGVQKLKQCAIVKMLRFSNDARCLETDRGSLRRCSRQSMGQSTTSELEGNIFLNGDWIEHSHLQPADRRMMSQASITF